MNDTVDLLNRQFQLALDAEGSQFITQLHRSLKLLDRQPLISPYLATLRREAEELFVQFTLLDENIDSLVRIRSELGQMAPELEQALRPELNSSDYRRWLSSLGAFDAIANGEPLFGQMISPHKSDASKTRRLLSLLRMNMTRSGFPQGNHPELEGTERALGEEEATYERRWRAFINEYTSHPGVGLLALEDLIDHVSQPGFVASKSTKLHPEAAISGHEDVHSIKRDLYDGIRLDDSNGELIRHCKMLAHRIHQELIGRVRSRQSIERLLARFKARCELHDRERLLNLANPAPKPENPLRDQLALWLFDQGLNPITDPAIGNLKPDLLDPASMYVEVKQYNEDYPRSKILKGINQLYETFFRLRTGHPEVTEAFFIVFRRGGPYLTIPECHVPSDGSWTIFFRTIDIASDGIGSKQTRQTQIITEKEVVPTAR